MSNVQRILILFGSQTFTAQEIAERIWRTTKMLGFRGPVLAMDDYPISQLIHEEFAIFVCATTGVGEEPDNMKKFWKFLLRRNLPANSLARLKFGVLGLGDSSYTKFNFAGKKMHRRLIQLGATPLIDIGLCDYQHDLGHEAVATPWLNDYYLKLKSYFPHIQIVDVKANFVPRWKVSLLKDDLKSDSIAQNIYYSNGVNDDSWYNVKLFEVTQNFRTTAESHFQDVRLITLKMKSDEKFDYNPGDVFNVRPYNSKEDVEDLFNIFKTHNIDIEPHYRLFVEELHEDMPVPNYLKQQLSIRDIAEQYWDLKLYPSQYVFSLLALVSEDRLERDKCIELSSPEGQEEWLNYCRRTKRTVLEVLHDFHKTASKLTIDILFELFPTIKPRSFSIASSPGRGRLEILVAVVRYRTKLVTHRQGLGSNWLKGLKVGEQVFGWIKKGSLKFPDDLNIPLVMIGPGTGLAPFRSVIQERVDLGTASNTTLHLFFGCRFRDKDFHCREELERLAKQDKLSLYTAFSRDQEDKIYVQHKIKEHSSKLWSLIDNNGHIFISGNAKNMPDNVRDAFVNDVFMEIGGLDETQAKQKIKDMEENGVLQVETWG